MIMYPYIMPYQNPYEGLDDDAEYLIESDDESGKPIWICPYCGLVYYPKHLFFRGRESHTFECDKCGKLIKCKGRTY